jgi:hypothetical protein
VQLSFDGMTVNLQGDATAGRQRHHRHPRGDRDIWETLTAPWRVGQGESNDLTQNWVVHQQLGPAGPVVDFAQWVTGSTALTTLLFEPHGGL